VSGELIATLARDGDRMTESTFQSTAIPAVLVAATVFFAPHATSSGDLRLMEHAPRIEDRAPDPEPSLLDELREEGRFTPHVRTQTYDEKLRPHPLIEEAVSVVLDGLRPYARGVYVTSLSRAPEDQRRLMKRRRYRYWTIQRSKHLLGGFAADIGFVRRRTSMWKLRDKAEELILANLGEEKAKKLRVVRESRCIHIEIDTREGREDIEQRAQAMWRWGILASPPPDGPNPVPSLSDYVPERHWRKAPRRMLQALPG
jgi:hypothetical protein